ncbi:MAG: DUF222 domain-containing protein [Microbacterium sp.]|uniref:HNH endonuclease signature motif containing protein n=1 Tax=Microbacterium sp. TaxID=51671 RepID=UPI001AC241CC|nr:HNH endonuclease signature motif containing protein [Microbacterium sp.]MBN9176524.1 DUF222 domain-containing protein [Microbacterium sp.]
MVAFSPREEAMDAARRPGVVDPHWTELSALVSRAERNRAEMSRLQAERAEVCAAALDLVALRVGQRRAARPGAGGEVGDTIPLREVLAELATVLHVSERTVSNWLGDGAALVGTYPATLAALREGRIDERHASAIIDAGMPLRPENRERYEEAILPIAQNETASAVRDYARAIAARLQPDIVEDNRRRAFDGRRVRTFDLDDGLSRLLLDAPTTLVRGIYERLTTMGIAQGEVDAEASDSASTDTSADASVSDLDQAPDERTLDQRRADFMCDLLLAGAPAAVGDAGLGAIRATVQITIPLLTLAGLDDDPALLDGTTPIDPGTARALAAAAPCWHRVMIHPVTAEPLRLDVYRPGTHLRRLIAARDQHCRWPGCRRPAHRADIDHTVPFADGGRTRPDNLEVLCRSHHTLKHASPWRVIQCGGGTLEFVSPTGRIHRNDAPPVVVARAAPSRGASLFTTARDPADVPPF